MISVICVFNDKATLDNYLSKSLSTQTAVHEFIPVDNVKHEFSSAAKALNAGARKATGKYLMFAHQDVRVTSERWLEDAERVLDSLPKLGVAGVAGKPVGWVGCITNIEHMDPPVPAGPIHADKPMVVQTLDECLAVIPSELFKVLQFDEVTCDDWHLYVVDYCLSAKLRGLESYVVPLHAYHRYTGGPTTEQYYETLKKVVKKHGRSFGRIFTTCGDWNTKYPLWLQRSKTYNYLRSRIDRLVGRGRNAESK
jgi:hypothetical protein